MKNPFENMDCAFEVMFNQVVVATLKSGEKQTIYCAVFNDVEDDTLSDDIIDTTRKYAQLVARQRDWCFVNKLQRGDNITMNNKQYSVVEVKNDFAIGMLIKIREK